MLNSKIIGGKIAAVRKKLNVSQAELARQLFISPQAVGKWERGESIPDIITLHRLAKSVGVDLNYFSEEFAPATTEIGEPSENRATEQPRGEKQLPVGPAGKKLSWDMSRGNWADADFSGLKNLHEKFSASNMQRCKFVGSELTGLLLKGNNVDSCDFSGSDLSNSQIQRSNLSNDIFKNCLLKATQFSKSNIDRCDFTGVDLTEAEFLESYIYGCDLTGADFTGVSIKAGGFSGVAVKADDYEKNTIANAVWNRTSFVGTYVADLVFTGKLEDCYFENCAFTRVTFRNATLINTFFKNNAKLKRIRFVDCQADRITYEFLKQGNADLSGISLLAT